MAVEEKQVGKTNQGRDICLYTITNKKGIQVQVMNYGAILVRLLVPDQNGHVDDVVLGFDDAEDYFINGSFFGATIGPSANRIQDASFQIDGIRYQLNANEGNNNLHSHIDEGYHKQLWDTQIFEDHITFTLDSPDGAMGFPGNKHISVTYTLTEDGALQIHYHATSDKKTIFNMTNHSYFNLAGYQSPNICKDILWIKASHYTPVFSDSIPTGEIASVLDTPMDFTTAKPIGRDIEADFEQLHLAGGYDHNWVIDDYNGQIQLIARLENPASGRIMETYTDLPGVQFYAGNMIDTQT
ncbi:MAG: aldose epimerase family protein, partial [Lachnospiraceae bacterium]